MTDRIAQDIELDFSLLQTLLDIESREITSNIRGFPKRVDNEKINYALKLVIYLSQHNQSNNYDRDVKFSIRALKGLIKDNKLFLEQRPVLERLIRRLINFLVVNVISVYEMTHSEKLHYESIRHLYTTYREEP